jgi:hypothetical protein
MIVEAGRRMAAIALSSGLLWLCSCSDRPAEERSAVAPVAGAGGEAGYFVDASFLDSFCVGSGVNYPIVTDERTIDGSNPAPADSTILRLHRGAFADALETYARKFLGEIGLREIVQCRRLSVDGTACYAFSDVEHGRLFINLDLGAPDAFLKRTLHHEVFHFVDFAEDGRLDEDRSWSALNPPSFLYGAGGGSLQNDAEAGRPDESLVGFVDRYAMSGLAEDKAEVYASLVFDGSWMARRASVDPILSRKMGLIRASLRRFGPSAPILPGNR